MKKLLLLIALIGCSMINAQDLRKYIPYKASVVGSINGGKILESITINELDNSAIGKELLKEFSKEGNNTINSIKDFGIDTNKITYFYYENTDEISYITMVFPLNESLFIENVLKNDNTEIINKGSYKLAKSGGNNFIAWDSEKMIYITGDLNESFANNYDFSEIEADLKAKKESAPYEVPTYEMTEYDIPYYSNNNLQSYVNKYYSFSAELSEAATNDNSVKLKEVDGAIREFNELIVGVDSIYESDATILTDFISNKSYFLKEAVKSYKSEGDRKRANKIIDEITFIGSDFNVIKEETYINSYESKIELASRFTIVRIDKIMKRPAKKSILKNKKYIEQFDENAVVNLWNDNVGTFFAGVYSTFYSMINYQTDGAIDAMSGYGQASVNLYMEDSQARVSFDMTLSDKYARRFERMTDKKINSNFFKYLNEDKFIGYVTYCMNTKNTLEEYPRLLAESYPLINKHMSNEEVQIIAEFISLLLDEEAVSKVILGDAMFVLSDITEQEVTYMDYEYDDDYNYNEIERTQIEKVPNFLFMASTEDTKLIDKVIAYLIKKGEVVKQKKYYEIVKAQGKDFPLGLYFAIKDGIFFVGTSKSEIKQIVNNKFVAKLSQKHKNRIENGAYSAYFSGTKFGQKFPFNRDAMNMSSEEVGKVNYLINNATDFYLKSSKIKNNKINSEFIMEVPEGNKNSIKYLLDAVDYMIKGQ